jgi:prepilin-type N-terminal cleavage/methylation domain-containing protein
VTAISENNPSGGRRSVCAFTLLEIIIALSLVAILVSASLPYLFDSFAAAAGDRAADAITHRVQEIRSKAMESGERQKIILTSSGISMVTLPSGWTLQVKGLNDSKFHAPSRNQSWEFNAAGICEPLSLRLSNKDREILLSFDALTAQPTHDDE